MKNKLITVLCLFGLITVFGCGASQQSQQQEKHSDVKSNIEEPKNLKESKICVMLFCSELQQKANGLEPKEGYLYNLGGMQVMQKVKGGYLLIPSSYFAGYGDGDIYDPVSLYTEQQFQQDQILSPEMNLWAYYVADTEYTTITGFNKKIHAFRLSDKKFVNRDSAALENKESAVGTHVSISREAEIALIAQKFVRQKLNLPDYSQENIKYKYTLIHKSEEPELIVKFADIDEKQVKYLDHSRWLVSSYVDYHNSRKYYRVDLTVTPSEEKLNDITFSNK